MIKRLISVSLLVSLLTSFNLAFSSGASALTFNPSFGVEVENPTPGAVSNIILKISQPAGDEIFKSVTFNVPAGFTILPSLEVDEGLQVGGGVLEANISGIVYPEFYNIYNTQWTYDLDGVEHLGHWYAIFTTFPDYVDIYIDGSANEGYTFSFQWPESMLSQISTPVNFYHYSIMGENYPFQIITNPSDPGDYVFQVDLETASGLRATKTSTFTIPGANTPVGENVTTDLGGSVGVTFANVTVTGQTSKSTQTTAPPLGTGQFQVSEGLYYDISTGASIECPCTVTLPYSPSQTDPKIYHQEGGNWVDVTTAVDSVNHIVTGVVSSFSYFVAAEPNLKFEWLSPVAAFRENKQFSINRNLPLNLVTIDENNNFYQPDQVIVELVNLSTNTQVGGDIVLDLDSKGDHLKGNIKFKDIPGIATGDYELRVTVVDDNTSTAYPQATVNFTLK